MRYIQHRKLSSLTPVAQLLRDIFSIKLSRAKERHAEAMGFNSFNHLSETVKMGPVECDFDDYIANLNIVMEKNHKLTNTLEKKDEIKNNLHIIDALNGEEKVKFHIYYAMPSSDSEVSEIENYKPRNFVNLNFINESDESYDFYYHDEYKELIEGQPTFIICSNSLTHQLSYFSGILFIVSTKPLESEFQVSDVIKVTQSSSFELEIDIELLKEKEGNIDYICEISSTIQNKLRDEEKKIIKKLNDGYIFPSMLSDNGIKEVLDGIESRLEHIYSGEFEEYKHCKTATIKFNKNSTYIEFASLNSVYEEKFDSEFLEAYAMFYSCLVNDYKKNKNLSIDFIDEMDDFCGCPDLYVHFSHFRSFKDEDSSIELFNAHSDYVDFNVLKELFILNEVDTIYAHAAIRHDCGNEMIYGCSAFDKLGNAVLQFQIFSASANNFYHTFLPKLKDETKLTEFIVSKDLEYDLHAPMIENYYDSYVYTFSFPKNNFKPLQLAFLIFQFDDFTSVTDAKSIHLVENEEVLPYITDRFRNATIGKPIYMPTDTSEWYSKTSDIVSQLRGSNPLDIDELHRKMISTFIDHNDKSELYLLASPILFELAEDDFSDMLLNTQACNEFGTEFKKVGAMSKALNIPILDYKLFVNNPSYKHY